MATDPAERGYAAIAQAELAGIDTGTPESDLRELLARKRKVLEAATGPALLSLMGQAAHDPELRQILHDDVYLAVRGELGALVDRATGRGELAKAVGGAQIDVLTLVLIGTALARSVFGETGASGTTAEAELHLLLAAINLA